MWDRPNLEGVRGQDLAWRIVPDGDFGAGGGVGKPLSADDATGAVSELVRLRTPQRGILAAGADLYVLTGEGIVNGRPYGPDHYLHVPPGGYLDLAPDGPPTALFLGTFGPPTLVAGVPDGSIHIEHLDTADLPWHSIPEHLSDGAVKWLRRDDRGVAFLSAKLPGWRSTREEAHPHAEESLRLSGDFWIGSVGVLNAGSYFFHRPGSWHGPLYTRAGTVALIRAAEAITTDYRDPATPRSPERSYLNLPHPALI